MNKHNYGLRVIGQPEPLRYTLHADKNGFIYCDFNDTGSEFWIISTLKEARMALQNPSGKGYSSYERPFHCFKPEELEIVEIVMQYNVVKIV